MTSPREGSAVILIDRDGRLLLQQRDDDHPPAGFGRWAIPGGGREGPEHPRETALREFMEETGVRLERLRFFRTVTREEDPRLFVDRLDIFFADDDVPRANIEVNEGLDFQYWGPAELANLPINPVTRELLEEFVASDKYRGTVAMKAPYREGVSILALDRWGRVLLQLRDADLPPERFPSQWSTVGGLLDPGEPPDAAAFREFEEETGRLLEELKLYRVYRRDPELPSALVDVQHVYYGDPDFELESLDVNEGQALHYFGPTDYERVQMPPHTRIILADFFTSPAYKAMFH